MTAPTMRIRPDVVAFVAAVRGQLQDLPAEVIDELTGGLEADLADLASESDTPLLDRIGSPAAYADELRSAAGLPPRGRRPGSRPVAAWQAGGRWLRDEPWWPGVRDFLIVVRPVWWVARALLPAFLVGVTLGAPVLGLVMGFALAVVSVELGRGRWRGRSARALGMVAGVAGVGGLLGVVVSLAAISSNVTAYAGDDPPYAMPGLASNGERVTNIFAYDARGQLIPAVQLFDQDGHPLGVDPDDLPSGETDWTDDGSEVRTEVVPGVDAYGQQLWNVFPLRTVERRYTMDGSQPTALGSPVPGRPSALTVPPLMGTDAETPAPTDTTASTTAPTPTGAAGAEPAPTGASGTPSAATTPPPTTAPSTPRSTLPSATPR